MASKDRVRDRSFMEKPQSGWLHDDTPLSAGQGLFYSFPVVYVGSMVITKSLRSLSVIDQTALMRDFIHVVAARVGLRDEAKPLSPDYLHDYLSGPITPAEVDVNLNISSEGLMIVPVEKDASGDYVEVGMLQLSPMRYISLAAGGEHEDYEFICYVGKNDVGHRECFVFDCGQLSDEVLETIGQAFVLANTAKKKADGTYDRPYQGRKRQDKGIYQMLPADEKSQTYAELQRGKQPTNPNPNPNPLHNTYFEVDGVEGDAAEEAPEPGAEEQYIVTEPSVRRKKPVKPENPYDNPDAGPSAPRQIKPDHPYDNPKQLMQEHVYGEVDNDSYGEPSLLHEGAYGDDDAPATEPGFTNPMYTEMSGPRNDPEYDTIPVDDIKSQYQHVDALPPLSDDDLEVEDKSELVRKLNHVDNIRRVVRGHEPGYLDVKGPSEGDNVRPDRPEWKYRPASSMKRVSLEQIRK